MIASPARRLQQRAQRPPLARVQGLLARLDDSQLDQTLVAISSGFVAGDRLNFSDQGGITGSYNASTGLLTLSGSATLSAYQAALRTISFDSTSENPGSGDRTLSWTIRDVNSDSAANGKQSSLSASTTIAVTPVNDPPVSYTHLTLPTSDLV